MQISRLDATMRTNMLLWDFVAAGVTIDTIRRKFEEDGGKIYPGVMQMHDGRLHQLGVDKDYVQHSVPYERSSTYEITPLTGKRSFLAEEGSQNLVRVWRIDKPGIIVARTNENTGLIVFTEHPGGQRVRIA